MRESFNATLECEPLAFHRFKTPREAAAAIFDSNEAGTIRIASTRRSAISHPKNFERRSKCLWVLTGETLGRRVRQAGTMELTRFRGQVVFGHQAA